MNSIAAIVFLSFHRVANLIFPQPEQNDPSIQPRKTFRFFEEAEAMEKLGQVFLRSKNPRFPVTVFLLPQVTPFIALPIYKRRQYRV